MGQFDINKATRMMRAGNEFSETNRKLRDAVWSFIEWLYEQLTEYQLPNAEEIGWSLRRPNQTQVCLNFKADDGGWHSVITNSDEIYMNNIVLCCRTLAGAGGERLVSWIEQQAQERKQFLAGLQEALQSLRSATSTASLP